MENRNGLVLDARVTPTTGNTERNAAVDMILNIPGNRRVTIGADKGYDTEGFVAPFAA